MSSRCSASTTTGGRPSRTSWRCGFANELFEPIWSSHHVDSADHHGEDIGLGGRAGYYDGIGAARDVIQNHLLQLLALTALEEPVSFHPDEVRAEKIKVLSATRLAEPLDLTTSRGQVRRGLAGRPAGGRPARRGGFSHTSTTGHSPRSPSTWTPGAGPVSFCAPENGWAAGSLRSR